MTGRPTPGTTLIELPPLALETALANSWSRSASEEVRLKDELRLSADELRLNWPPAEGPATGVSNAEMDASSAARMRGENTCAADLGDPEVSDDEREGIDGRVSMGGGAEYIVECEPVEVRDRMEGTDRIEGTGECGRGGTSAAADAV